MTSRREFIAVTGGAIVFAPPPGRWRFRQALRRAIDIKRIHGEIGQGEAGRYAGALDERMIADGSTASVCDHVHKRVSQEIPWWRNILNWILENWSLVLKILLTLITILETP